VYSGPWRSPPLFNKCACRGIEPHACPFPTDPLIETMWWHPMYDSDKAHAWLRGIFIQAGIDIT
jgi:hypothetical protein